MYLYGASGHAKVIIEILELCGVVVKGLFDDNPEIRNILDYKVLGSFNSSILNNDQLIISIGDNNLRKEISKKIFVDFGIAIHPSAVISKRSNIGSGTVIMGNAIINSDTKIGKHVIINTSASIDHDCTIEDFVHISPNVALCGSVTVQEGTHIGAGSVVIPGVKIGKWCIIGAGSVIIKDVPDNCTVVGNPARVIK